ncbi:hypothetical protein EKK58_10570 [Candidatus Dependentiae bacterium]|nr:MAG: hypothetical protein EKK58_10570 [Candidatus Dependentiae bacterium]
MSFAVDNYFNKKFHPTNYNCWDFIRDVWMDITKFDIGCRTPNPSTPKNKIKRFMAEESDFIKVPELVDPCIILFKRNVGIPHVGVYTRGRVLHISEKGVKFEHLEIAKLGFNDVGFYICKK